jgi:hypothetical protein
VTASQTECRRTRHDWQRDTNAVPLNCRNLGRRFGSPACVVLAAVNLNATAISLRRR